MSDDDQPADAASHINLRGEMSFCHDERALPGRLGGCPRLSKPFATATLIRTLGDMAVSSGAAL